MPIRNEGYPMRETTGIENCHCGCNGNLLECALTEGWVNETQEAIHATYDGWYFDLDTFEDSFLQKITRLFVECVKPEKAAKIIMRYASFTNYLQAKSA